MSSVSAVSIYDDLTSGQSAVSVRSTDNETSGRIYKELRVLIYHILRKDLIKHVFLDVCVDLLLCHFRIMLCGKNDSVQSCRLAILIVLYRNLSLSIRTKVSQCAILAHLGQLKCKLLCQCDRIRHILLGLICRITKHHTLISGADRLDLLVIHLVLFCFQRLINTHCDIGRLLVNRCNDCAGICIKPIFSSCVANLTDRIADDLLNVHICFRRDLAHNQYQTGRRCCLAGYTAHRILLHQRVQDRIRNLVAHFIRMSFCYGFGCK